MSFGGRGPKTANRKAHLKRGRTERKKAENNELIQLAEKALQADSLGKDAEKFSQLPISQRTLKGLEGAHFVEMTDIQKATIPTALAGKDVLGSAKTGSGKTLAFLIPLLEKLYREKWSPFDGLGALVLSPTRELALQTFEVLRRIGKYHTLSAGLVIGGKDLKAERVAIGRMNILIATPGRLLQHFDQTLDFDWNNLQMLVLDEADRILDLGFARTIDAIIATLPTTRQTLLFSATQSSTSIKDLARLSLSPSAVTISTEEDGNTPSKLEHLYLCCPLSEKMDRLFSFIKGHLKRKTIIFFSSCKEVRFVYEAFCKLQPGVPLMHLHGRQKQMKRVEIFHDFCRKAHAVLFATDIAARGLDFPAVDWVVQVDCPEDVETYIHRAGRTARFQSEGKSLLFLNPSEKDGMLNAFNEKSIPIKSLHPENRPLPPPKRTCRSQLQALCSQDPEIKYLAQKALISYVKSVHLNGNKNVFQVKSLPIDEFALSLGLASTPKLRFVSRAAKNVSRDQQSVAAGSSSDDAEEEQSSTVAAVASKQVSKLDKMFKRKNQNILSEHYSKLRNKDAFDAGVKKEEEDDGEFLVVKRRDHEIDLSSLPAPPLPGQLSRRDLLKTKKRHLLKIGGGRSHVRFTDQRDNDDNNEGDLKVEDVLPFTPESHFDRLQVDKLSGQYVAEETEHMKEVDSQDAERLREFRRTKKAEKKRRQLEAARSAVSKAPRLE